VEVCPDSKIILKIPSTLDVYLLVPAQKGITINNLNNETFKKV
jgi:hypothetical protein